MNNQRTTVILVILLIMSSLVFFYPDLSDYWNSHRQTKVIADYEKNMSEMDQRDYSEMIELAQQYNEKLASKKRTRFENGEPLDEEYASLLNINDSNMMGYITIEKINVDVPVYHGTSESVLSIATGHLEGSSLPIGGESTHTVITGHRGLASAMLFTDLDKMEQGDIFTLTILSQVLTYQVDQIRIVDPEEVEDLHIIDGEDYCTLVTCTPYGINTERMLVRGTRIDNIEGMKNIRITSEATIIDPMIVFAFIVIPAVVILLVIILLLPVSKKEI